MSTIVKRANKLVVTLGLLSVLAMPVAFGSVNTNAWYCYIGWFRYC